METSRAHQKQKLTLLKLRRLAQHTSRPIIFIAQKLRAHLAITTVGVTASVGLPVLVLATQQSQADKNTKTSQSQVTEITIDSAASPSKAEVFSTPNETTLDITSNPSNEAAPVDTSVTINGEPTSLQSGSVFKQYVSEDGSIVDINLSIGSSSTNSSGSSSTDISIDSSSFSTGSTQDSVRGSPRR